jgi:hypothetical protein
MSDFSKQMTAASRGVSAAMRCQVKLFSVNESVKLFVVSPKPLFSRKEPV